MNHNSFSSSFTLLQPDWIQLSPYGDFPHAHGLQRVDRAAAERVVQRFRSFMAKLGRAFGGLPFYIGHPDAPGLSERFPDRKAYGWIMELEAREEGLFARPKWSAEGRALIQSAHYKYVSPLWEAQEIGPGIYTPARLISSGLTNEPNLPVLPLSNSALPPKPATAEPVAADARAVALLDQAVIAGRIRPHERLLWNGRLAANFDEGAALLANLAPAPAPASLGLRKRKPAIAAFQERQREIQALVRARMAQGLDYTTAWTQIKQEHPALFASTGE